MFGIFEKPFNEIQLEDIELLIQNSERESQFLDYKLKLEKDDIAADACAMANSRGGYIILGISENNEADEGYPKEIVGLENAKTDEIIIREKIKDLIDPHISGFNVRIVESIDKVGVVLIYIPNSPMKPHFVRKSKNGPFPVRVNRITSYWAMGDVRNQIISRVFYEDRMEKIFELLQKQAPMQAERTILTLTSFPLLIGEEYISLDDRNIAKQVINPPYDIGFDAFDKNCYKLNYFLNGFEGVSLSGDTIIRLHRNLIYEFHRKFASIVNPYKTIFDIASFFVQVKWFYEYYSIYDPVVFSFSIINSDSSKKWDTGDKVETPVRDTHYFVSYDSIFLPEISKDFQSRFWNSLGRKG